MLLPDTRLVARVAGDFSAAGRIAANTDGLRAGVVGTGLVLASSALDRRGDRFAKDHADSRWLKGVNRVGSNALPWLALGGAAAAAMDGSDPALSRAGSRQHWVSDTVAGSLLGYAIGKVFWESSRAPRKGAPRMLRHPSGVNVAWALN